MTDGRSSGPATEPRRVLVVDDDPDLQQLLAELLTDEGYDVTATDSAIGGRALVGRVQPEAILLDLGLPYRSGASLLVELKADPRTAPIPVIVLSGMPAVLAGERRTLAAAVIPKPFEVQALLEALRTCCRRGPVKYSYKRAPSRTNLPTPT